METIINWLFNLKVFDAKKRELYTKAFSDAYKDLEETNVYNTEEKAKELTEKKLLEMLNPVDLTRVVSLDKSRGILFIGGEKVDEAGILNLKQEAEYFQSTQLWKLLYNTPKKLAEESMFISGESLADMQKGKTILYTLSTQKNIMDIFSSYTQKK